MTAKTPKDKIWSKWFEIPATNFDRAVMFYETILNIKIDVNNFGNFKMGIFPHADFGAAICWGEDYKPSDGGIVIYLDANPDLIEIENRIEPAGGKILQAKKHISDQHGFMAFFQDSEGNRLALHSMA